MKNVFVRFAGGETIKQINQQSGAFCELDRRPPPNPSEKIFIVRGSHEQVDLAKRMISEKLGLVRISVHLFLNPLHRKPCALVSEYPVIPLLDHLGPTRVLQKLPTVLTGSRHRSTSWKWESGRHLIIYFLQLINIVYIDHVGKVLLLLYTTYYCTH